MQSSLLPAHSANAYVVLEWNIEEQSFYNFASEQHTIKNKHLLLSIKNEITWIY